MTASEAFVAAAHAAADAAGAAIRPHFRTALAADDKADDSPVTVADRAAETAIRSLLAERFPQHDILGEEFPRQGPGTGLCWVIDPIDGTRAFITGRPTFATLIALLDGHDPILGMIDQPITGERWLAVRGGRAEFRGAHGRPGCRPCPSLAAAELSCTSPDIFSATQFEKFRQLQSGVRRTSWGGDGYGYGLLALGQIDVIVEPGLKPWDWAAIVPVIEAAGGCVTDWRGAPLRLDGTGDVIAVGDKALLPQILDILG